MEGVVLKYLKGHRTCYPLMEQDETFVNIACMRLYLIKNKINISEKSQFKKATHYKAILEATVRMIV